MATRRSVGIAGGEYKGAGQGDISSSLDEDVIASGSGDSFDTGDIDISTSDDRPLHFFFDIETTGFNIYAAAITDIGAKVVTIPTAPVSQPTFGSLVMTSKHIPEKGRGKNRHYFLLLNPLPLIIVAKLTGIHNTDLLGQPPLSVVLRELLSWISSTTEEYSETTDHTHFPGNALKGWTHAFIQ
jgi:hypothetical protein